MGQQVDLRGVGQEEHCEDLKEVASKVGVQVVCNDDDAHEHEDEGGLHLPESEECEDSKEVASKFGVQVVCDDE